MPARTPCPSGRRPHAPVRRSRSPKVLTAVLRRLEEHELITRTVYPDVPLHVEYELTDLGRDACVPLGALLYWVEDNVERFPAVP
ncbi:MAG TPA: helix-turn-helix domain-containing protein [Actinoallomurus sp.]|nr:helix-turn-helix domain-containing protein [Actinoallomurus sp.]